MKLVFRPNAQSDLEEIYEYIKKSSFSVTIAQEQLRKIIKSMQNFKIFPFMGRPFDDFEHGARIFSIGRRASIIYRVEDMEVIILRVFYAGRDF